MSPLIQSSWSLTSARQRRCLCPDLLFWGKDSILYHMWSNKGELVTVCGHWMMAPRICSHPRPRFLRICYQSMTEGTLHIWKATDLKNKILPLTGRQRISEIERDPRCDHDGLKDRRTHTSGNTGSFQKLKRQGNRHHSDCWEGILSSQYNACRAFDF